MIDQDDLERWCLTPRKPFHPPHTIYWTTPPYDGRASWMGIDLAVGSDSVVYYAAEAEYNRQKEEGMFNSTLYLSLYNDAKIDIPYDKWLRNKIKQEKEDKKMGQGTKRLELHLEVTQNVLTGYVIYQNLGDCEKGLLVERSGGVVTHLTSASNPAIEYDGKRLFVRGSIEGRDRQLFHHEYEDNPAAIKAMADIKEMVAAINSPNWKPGQDIGKPEVKFPIEKNILISKRPDGDFILYNEATYGEQVCWSSLEVILGRDFINAFKKVDNNKKEGSRHPLTVTLHAPEEE